MPPELSWRHTRCNGVNANHLWPPSSRGFHLTSLWSPHLLQDFWVGPWKAPSWEIEVKCSTKESSPPMFTKIAAPRLLHWGGSSPLQEYGFIVVCSRYVQQSTQVMYSRFKKWKRRIHEIWCGILQLSCQIFNPISWLCTQWWWTNCFNHILFAFLTTLQFNFTLINSWGWKFWYPCDVALFR